MVEVLLLIRYLLRIACKGVAAIMTFGIILDRIVPYPNEIWTEIEFAVIAVIAICIMSAYDRILVRLCEKMGWNLWLSK